MRRAKQSSTPISCFSHVTFERMLNMAADVRVLAELGDANAKYPIYRGLWQGTPLTFALAMVGAPSCVAMLEELHARVRSGSSYSATAAC